MIELYHAVKTYPGAERPALDDVSLSVQKGELCLLTGPSGAGKTTLLRLLFCAEPLTKGQMLIGGRNLSQLSARKVPRVRRNLGVIFQDFKLLPNFNVFENVALSLEVQGRRRTVIDERVHKILKEVGLSHKAAARCDQLSGGEQQRVAIARALVTDPAIVLADEPTGNLDPERSRAIFELLERANARGTTVLVATHDPSLLEGTRRVIHLEKGRVVHRGLK